MYKGKDANGKRSFKEIMEEIMDSVKTAEDTKTALEIDQDDMVEYAEVIAETTSNIESLFGLIDSKDRVCDEKTVIINTKGKKYLEKHSADIQKFHETLELCNSKNEIVSAVKDFGKPKLVQNILAAKVSAMVNITKLCMFHETVNVTDLLINIKDIMSKINPGSADIDNYRHYKSLMVLLFKSTNVFDLIIEEYSNLFTEDFDLDTLIDSLDSVEEITDILTEQAEKQGVVIDLNSFRESKQMEESNDSIDDADKFLNDACETMRERSLKNRAEYIEEAIKESQIDEEVEEVSEEEAVEVEEVSEEEAVEVEENSEEEAVEVEENSRPRLELVPNIKPEDKPIEEDDEDEDNNFDRASAIVAIIDGCKEEYTELKTSYIKDALDIIDDSDIEEISLYIDSLNKLVSKLCKLLAKYDSETAKVTLAFLD